MITDTGRLNWLIERYWPSNNSSKKYFESLGCGCCSEPITPKANTAIEAIDLAIMDERKENDTK